MSGAAMVLAVLLPVIAAVLIAFAGKLPNVREFVSLAIAGLVLVLVLALIPGVLAGARPSIELVRLLPGVGLTFTLEPLGMVFAFVAALLWPLASLYSIGYMRGNDEKHQTRFYACFAIAIGSALGVAFSGNLLTLFVFYEVLSLSTYPLVTHKGNAEAMAAGRLYLGILLSTSIGLLLLAILVTWQITGSVDFVEGGLLRGEIGSTGTGLLLVLFIYGIGKAALMPVHRWLAGGHGGAHAGECVAARGGGGEGGRVQRGEGGGVCVRAGDASGELQRQLAAGDGGVHGDHRLGDRAALG